MKARTQGCRSAAGAWLAAMVLLWTLASASLPVRAQDTAAGPQRQAAPVLVVGSKRFTESYILGEILRRTAESAGEATVRHEQGLGNTGIVQAALASGAIDLYVEYTGTLAREILRLDDPQDATAMARALGQRGLAMSRPLGFNNTYALAMQEQQADRLGISRISDLAGHPSLRLGLTQEFIGRADGWPGLRSRYALPFDTPRGMEHGLKFGALAARQLDVIDVYSTDAAIARNGLRVLQDDRDHFPRYDAVVLYRAGLQGRLPRTWAAIAALEGRLDDATMRALNARAEAGGESFAAIAAQFLSAAALVTPPQAAGSAAGGATDARPPRRTLANALFGEDFLRLAGEHLVLVFGSLLLSTMVGVPLGIWCAASAAARRWVLPAVALVQTIPSLALLAFLIAFYERIGMLPALTALFLYGLLPIVRNTCAGLEAIPQALRDAALALGLPRSARLLRIELPLALGAILAGVQTSAVINVGTATIAAFIGAGGFGERIATGLALNDATLLLAGALPAAGLALLVQLLFSSLERRLLAPPLRPAAGRRAA
ncbi:MAG: glycine betaine ABC transporter substrate-binding protein [Pseudomonadota bacterium]